MSDRDRKKNRQDEPGAESRGVSFTGGTSEAEAFRVGGNGERKHSSIRNATKEQTPGKNPKGIKG